LGSRHKKPSVKTEGYKLVSGDEGDRTPDLGVANAALSHLSYIPTRICFHIKLIKIGQSKIEPNSLIEVNTAAEMHTGFIRSAVMAFSIVALPCDNRPQPSNAD
jgi:hypothetical protein